MYTTCSNVYSVRKLALPHIKVSSAFRCRLKCMTVFIVMVSLQVCTLREMLPRVMHYVAPNLIAIFPFVWFD
jgi:hypothetical protein